MIGLEHNKEFFKGIHSNLISYLILKHFSLLSQVRVQQPLQSLLWRAEVKLPVTISLKSDQNLSLSMIKSGII
jgi:hypothetical protein